MANLMAELTAEESAPLQLLLNVSVVPRRVVMPSCN